jgi:hypothetical protein
VRAGTFALGVRAPPLGPRRVLGAGCAPLRSVSEESIGVALGGRGVPENVTSESRRPESAGPIPLTRLRFASEPNGPRFSRSTMIRRARTGPTPGRALSWSAVARSTSIFPPGNARIAFPLGDRRVSPVSRAGKLSGGRRWRPGLGDLLPRAFPAPFPCFARRAESTAASWFSIALEFAGASLSIVPTARNARTETPSSATLVRKSSAFFSAGVGMGRV